MMTARKPLPSFMELCSFLLAHESQLQIDTTGSFPAQAIMVSHSPSWGGNQNCCFRGGYHHGGHFSQFRGDYSSSRSNYGQFYNFQNTRL